MRSTATNPVGEATEVLMALAVERILSKHATSQQRDKARLAMRADLASPGIESCVVGKLGLLHDYCLLYTSPSPRDKRQSRMPSSA